MGKNISKERQPNTSSASTITDQEENDDKTSRVFFLLHRTWAVMVTDRWTKTRLARPTLNDDDAISTLDSEFTFCTCSQCIWKDELLCDDGASDLFSSECTMSPNLEESGRLPALCWEEDTLSKEKQRPPLYNPEDYAASVKKWAKKHGNGNSNLYTSSSLSLNELDCPRSRNSSFRDYRNPMLISAGSEMTLRQFGTVSELLCKLRADLRLSYPSFVQEFVSDPHDGVTLLLELLRSVQLSQGNNTNTMNNTSNTTTGRIPPSVQRKALLDELTCLQCLLCCCVRYSESVRRLSASSAGLFTLAVCIMSNVNKARIIALQLLTKACEPSATGHIAVSEAMSTLRLRYGEPVRFRFLVGMLISAGGQGELLASGLKFINTFLDTASNTQKRLYIQAELEQAGLDITMIKQIIPINSPSAEFVFEELDHWEKNHIDIEALTTRMDNAEKQNDYLKDKVLLLERRIQILQEEKGVLMSLEQCLKERCSELQVEVTSLKSEPSEKHKIYSKRDFARAEDEGISSSERSLTPEDNQVSYDMYTINNETIIIKPDNTITLENKLIQDDEETTIDDVIEELKNIVNDAQTEEYNKQLKLQANKELEEQIRIEKTQVANKIQMRVNVLIDGPVFDCENEIIPCNLHPQPPRKSRSLVQLYTASEDEDYNNKEIFFENETPYTSDEGSDSLLSASKCRLPRVDTHAEMGLAKLDCKTNGSLLEKQLQCLYTSDDSRNDFSCFGGKLNSNFKSISHNIDGFFVASYTEAPIIGEHQNIKSALDEFSNEKTKSKSLDRIDNGLETMVDIVMTNQNYSKRNFRLKSQSDSGNATGTTLSRSTSNIFLNNGRDFKISKLPSDSKSDDKHKMFLPTQEQRDREVHYYFPTIQDKCNLNNSFVIKRGHVNDGLYSGFCFTKNDPSNSKRNDVIVKHKSQLNSLSKVTDLPSGLY